MISNELMDELQNLSRADKLRVVQMLVNDLATDETALLMAHTEYEIWSPYDSASAAKALMQMLHSPARG
jgi:hypothetical protein